MSVQALNGEGQALDVWRFSTGLHCPDSDQRYTDPIPSMFSFNSAVGACESCRGFGRVIGVDYGLNWGFPDNVRVVIQVEGVKQ